MEATTKTQRALESAARWLVLLGVLSAPWLFGGADPWAYWLISLCVFSGLAIWLFAGVGARRFRLRAAPVAGVLGLLAGLILLQLAPLPLGLVKRVSALAATQALASRTLLEQMLQAAPAADAVPPRLATLSLSPPATFRSLVLFLAYLSTFLVLANTIRERAQLRRTATVLVVSVFAMAVLAVVHKFSGSEEIFWFHTPRYGGNVFGPFSNRNHLAAHLNMTLGLAVGLLLSSRRFYQAMGCPDLRDRIAMLSSREGARTVLRAFMVLILMGAVAVSVSRGAVLSLAVTATLFGTVIFWRRRSGARLVAGFVLPMLLFIGTLLWFGRAELLERIGSLTDVMQNPFGDLRYVVTHDCLRIIAGAPLCGIGFGTFEHVYSAFQTPPLDFHWLHAHDDWVQLAVEGGLLGALLFGTALALWLRHLAQHFPRASGSSRVMALGILYGLSTIAFHSLFDYSLHKPANAFLLAAMAGMAVAAVHVRRTPSAAARARPPRASSGAALAVAILALAGVVVLEVALQWRLRGAMAAERVSYLRQYLQRAPLLETRDAALAVGLDDAQSVLQWGGNDADTLMSLSETMLEWAALPNLPGDLQPQLAALAGQAAIAAVRSAPVDYMSWLWFARIHMARSDWDASEQALARARQLVLHPEQVHMFSIKHTPDDNRQIP